MLLDVFERAVVLLVFGHFAFVMVGKASVLSLILLASESLPVFLILTRREANALSDQIVDWLYYCVAVHKWFQFSDSV